MPAAGIRSLQPNEINTVISACVGLGNGVLLRHNTQETRRDDAGSNRTLESLVGQCLDHVVTAYLEQTCIFVMSVNWSLGWYLFQIKKKFRNLVSQGLWLFLIRVCVCGNVIEYLFVNRHCTAVIVYSNVCLSEGISWKLSRNVQVVFHMNKKRLYIFIMKISLF